MVVTWTLFSRLKVPELLASRASALWAVWMPPESTKAWLPLSLRLPPLRIEVNEPLAKCSSALLWS